MREVACVTPTEPEPGKTLCALALTERITRPTTFGWKRGQPIDILGSMLKPSRRRARFSAAVVTSLLSSLLAGAASVDIPRTGQLVVGQNADGRLELLKVDQDGELRQIGRAHV